MTPREIAEKSVFDLIKSGDLSRFERLTAVRFIKSLTKENRKTLKIEQFKTGLSHEPAKVTFTLNNYGFFTQTEEKAAESSRDELVDKY